MLTPTFLSSNRSYIIESTADTFPGKLSRDQLDVSLMIRADVVELASRGLMFAPREYCMDFGPVRSNPGIGQTKVSNSDVGTGSLEETRELLVGSNALILKSLRRSTSWTVRSHATDKSFESYLAAYHMDGSMPSTSDRFRWISEAFHTPKQELLALLDTLPSCDMELGLENCVSTTYTLYESAGIVLDKEALVTASEQFYYLRVHALDKWVEKVTADHAENRLFKYTAPMIFEPNLAYPSKNAGFSGGAISSLLANPYVDSDEIEALLQVSEQAWYAANHCFDDALAGAAAQLPAAVAYFLPEALQRRLVELERAESHEVPLPTFGEWGSRERLQIDEGLFSIAETFQLNNLLDTMASNSDTLIQKPMFDNQGELLPGNLTAKILGKTADWFMVTNFSEPDKTGGFGFNSDAEKLHDLVVEQLNTDVYQRAQTNAFSYENPCYRSVEDSEIFLYILGMVTAACGGVHAILISLHHVAHWISYKCCRRRANRTPVQGIFRVLPTYELGMVVLGWLLFVALYLPIIIQVSF